jgi:alpha-1,6-mannosyltransferase
MTRGRAIALGICALALSTVATAWSIQGDQTHRIASFLPLFALAAVAYLCALRAARGLTRPWLAAALALAALWRIGLVVAPPVLSDDIYRYVWEGRIQLHGGNPYARADGPEADKWIPLRDDVWRQTTFKDMTAIYPPTWQLAARLVVGIHDSVTAMKAFVVVCEVVLWLVVLGLLARRRLPADRVLVVAWSPLALVEFAGSGHNDAFGILLATAAFVALEVRQPFLSACGVTLGGLTKFLPGFFGVAWIRRYSPRHLLLGIAAGLLVVLPYLGEPRGLIRSLAAYSGSWRFNHSFFALFSFLFGRYRAPVIAAAVTLAVAAVLGWKRVDPARAALAVTATWLLLTPNVLPWYALWLLPWLAVVDAPAALAFTLTVPLAYLVYPGFLAGGPWQVGWGVRALEYGPCLALALWSWGLGWRRQRDPVDVR